MPGTEAHGGYTFCGFAALVLLNRTDLCDLQALLVNLCILAFCRSPLSNINNNIHQYYIMIPTAYSK